VVAKLDVRYRVSRALDNLLDDKTGVLQKYRLAGYLEAILMVWNFIPRKGVYPFLVKKRKWGPFKWTVHETYLEYIARKSEDLLLHLIEDEDTRDLDMSTYRR
jgi:hypothetical protein